MNEIQAHTLLENAILHVEEGKPLHAVQILRRLIDSDPGTGEAYLQLAQIYVEWHHFAQAEKVLLAGHSALPDDPELVLMLGNLSLRQQHFFRALTYYERIRHLRIPQVHFNLGLAYMNAGNLRKSEEELRIAAACDSHFPKVYELLGELLILQGKFGEAIKELRRAIKHDPYSSLGHRLLGTALARISRWEDAYEQFVLAVDMDPNDFQAWKLCGDSLMRLGRFEEAGPYIKKAMSLNPDSPDAFVSFGYLCLEIGDTEKALESFDRALQVNPGHPKAINGKLRLTTYRNHTP